jgi:hypothetical protein
VGHLGCLHSLTIVNSAAINKDVQEILLLEIIKTPRTKATMVNAQGYLLQYSF